MKNRRKQRRSRPRIILIGLFIVAVFAIFLGTATVIGVLNHGDEWLEDLPSVDQEEALAYGQKSTMYAADGTTVLAEFQMENRTPLSSLSEVSTYVVQGTVDTEDSRFYEHQGVDTYGILRAAFNTLMGNREGASTITQQLVRNTIISDEANDISLKRKLREIKLALEMEKKYTKDEILLMYLNTVNYGDGCYGIEAAAQHYFSKSASELTLTESATLAGIPQSPTYLNPTVYPEACKTRRNAVLGRMLSMGHITQEEYDAAVAEELVLDVTPVGDLGGIYKYPYFTTYVRDLLMEEYTTAEIFEGGWKIYTTLDVDMQDKAEAACAAEYSSLEDGLEVAMVALDPKTGAVKAIVGGEDFYENQFNVATQKGRPTGSTFKAFTLVTAINQGISPSTLIDCSATMTYGEGEEQITIENFEGTDYGIRSISSATAVSSNTGFIRLCDKVTPAAVVATARSMGIEDASLPEVVSVTLGVADVTPLEMASAYGTLATGGTHYDHYVISKIVDADGNVIYEHESESERVLSESVAGATTDVLKGVLTSGTGTTAKVAGYDMAGKTGTSEDYKDHWMIGYTTNLVCAAWIGDRNNVISSKGITANAVWKRFMTAALEGTQNEAFPTYTQPNYNNSWNSEQNSKYYSSTSSSTTTTTTTATTTATESETTE